MSNGKRCFLLRLTALMLSVLLLNGMLSGCKKSNGDDEYSTFTSEIIIDDGDDASQNQQSDNSQGSGKTESGSKSSGGSASSSSSGVKNVETKGKTFTIMSAYLPQSKAKAQYTFEKLFWQRAQEVEKEYGVTIKVINGYPNTNNIASRIMAGKKIANVLEANCEDITGMASAGYIIPWDSVNGIDIGNSNFWAGYTKAAALGSKHYGLQFEKPPEPRFCIAVNKTLLKNNGIDANGIYTLVKNRQWNFAKLLEYAQAATNSSAGTYGIGGTPGKVAQMLIAANGGKIVTIDSAGKAHPSYTSNNIKNALDWMNDIVNNKKVYMTSSDMFKTGKADSASPDYVQSFIDGKLAFLMDDSWVFNQKIRPAVAKKGNKTEYGLLPVPLGPDAGNKAYSSLSSNARVFVITKTNNEQDFTAKIFNALAEYPNGYDKNSWQSEIASDYFQSGDTQSLEIYMQLVNNMETDPGIGLPRVYSEFINKSMYEPIFYGSGKTPGAAIDAIGTSFNKTIEGLF